jgi:valyl-tRNA synthetase
VKGRAYGTFGEARAASAHAALRAALSIVLRLLAPVLPYVTEEIWSWWQPGSVHRSAWPSPASLDPARDGDPAVFAAASEVVRAVRRAKTEAKKSMRAAVESLAVTDDPARLALLEAAADDIREAGSIAAFALAPGTPELEIRLADE